MAQKFYLTTPIYYVNARPHIGHAYTTIVADVLARRHRLLGDDTFFLTGTDEHGQKIERSAAAAGIPPQQFADEVSKSFETLWQRMGITHDDYIRTTDPRHTRGVQKLFADLHARGQIYLSSYTGQYSIGEEMFVEGPPGTIGPDGRPTETVTEENFFFRLGDFQEQLINLIESDTLLITPGTARNEVLSFIRGNIASVFGPNEHRKSWANNPTTFEEMSREAVTLGRAKEYAPGKFLVIGALKDLSVSRSSFTWGIPVPEPAASEAKEKHVIYVWLDALANYMTAVGYGSDSPADIEKFNKYWPADLHLVGKEIIRFHCVYWPAFLLAAGLPLPKAITAHGWLLFDDSKMSKSKGNIVRTETILDAFGTLCPPTPAGASPDPGGPSFAPLAKGGLSSEARPSSSDQPQNAALKGRGFSPAASIPSEPAALAAEGISDPPQNPVILSEAQSAESKNPDEARITSTAEPFPTTKPEAPTPPTKAQQDLFAADILRYFLLREIPFGQDGSFSFDALITRYNADLANGYGNLVSRTLKMIQQSSAVWNSWAEAAEIPPYEGERFTLPISRELKETVTAAAEVYARSLDARDFNKAIEQISIAVAATDGYISAEAPWKLAKIDTTDAKVRLTQVLYTASQAIRIITILLHPILPYATSRVWQQLGLPATELLTPNSELSTLKWGLLPPGTKLGPLGPIFPRADKGLAQIMADAELPPNLSQITDNNDATHPPQDDLKTAPIASEAPKSKLVDESFIQTPPPAQTFDPAAGPRTTTLAEPDAHTHVAGSGAVTTERNLPPSTDPLSTYNALQIAIDDFIKIDLRVAKIVVAERIPKADKLLRLEVDLGYETRQILSGIAEYYTPEELVGKRIIIIANLAPRKMRGLESHGMLLAASAEGGKPILATFPESEELPLGSRLK
jgi:methionyl-tRNA synthetase